MTTAEAIKRIQVHMEVHRIGRHPHTLIGEALDKAIEALREMQRREDLKPLIIDAKAASEINQLLDEIKHLKPTICTDEADVVVVDQRWIPVTERLPEKEGTYLVCSDRGAVYTTHFYVRHAAWTRRGKIPVTHWMPLPEPPEEE